MTNETLKYFDLTCLLKKELVYYLNEASNALLRIFYNNLLSFVEDFLKIF